MKRLYDCGERYSFDIKNTFKDDYITEDIADKNSVPGVTFLMAAIFGQGKSSIFLSLPKSNK
ncbi:hypothetical protein CFP56_000511 [Quercus suber]|uniref:Uncharacterized protein n=1 Tax=Quercus suber TaxID=58331 RepID=A0AAW0LI33_QUESU